MIYFPKEDSMQNMIIKKIPKHIVNSIKKDTIKPEQIAQLLVEGSVFNHLKSDFHKYSAIYRQTNEPISSYLNNLNLKGKDALTVTGSGDFLLSLINKDINYVATFDISIFTKFYQNLKFTALLNLNYEDFLNFFYGNKIFDCNIYDHLRFFLVEETRQFWDSLFDFYEPSEIIDSPLFMQQMAFPETAIINNTYLQNKSQYSETQEKARNIKFDFYNLDILKLPISLKRKFDIILISNIRDYSHEMGESLEDFVQYLQNNFGKLLKENGLIIGTTFTIGMSPCRGENWELTGNHESVKTLKIYKGKGI